MEYIRPDTFNALRFEHPKTGEMTEFVVNAKFDRVDFFPKLGAFILKAFTDDGLVSLHLDEDNAMRVVGELELPLVWRDFMYKSEHENWITAQARALNDDILEE